MRNKKKRSCLAAVPAAIVLITLITACASNPRIEVIHETPDIPAFPAFPPPDCVTFDEGTETVSMPLWYWQKIAEYKISVDAIREYLAKLRTIKDKTP